LNAQAIIKGKFPLKQYEDIMKSPADVDARVAQSREKLIHKMRSHVTDNFHGPELKQNKDVKVYHSHIKNPQVFGPYTPLGSAGASKFSLN